MKVLLLDNVRGIGKVGDVKDVADGYARNFLLKRNLARAATDGTIRDAAQFISKKREAVAMVQAEAQELAAKLTGTTVEISGKANEKGTLFAAISSITIDGATFELPEHIKTTGNHPVTLRLAEGVTADITVSVTAA
ncbi:MAG TPA: 50S ribosomal protein L9 [Candidatus Paceibacterota bacterium]|nr:50S ribosomal protein L9 [Candidatus Paceibacterota bacterium]